MKRHIAYSLTVSCLFAGWLSMTAGCSNNSSAGVTPAEQQKGDRLQAIATKSNGDWSKLSQDDKNFYLKQVSGDPRGAQMLLLAEAGKLGYHGGAKPPGAPGGAPGTPAAPGNGPAGSPGAGH